MCPYCAQQLGSNDLCVYCQDAKRSVQQEMENERIRIEFRERMEALRKALREANEPATV